MNALLKSNVTLPSVYVTINKNRIKHYDSLTKVYMNDNQDFELELFNPTTDVLLAKIKLNGHNESNGLILKPGERVFLERHLDDNKKLCFKTYSVNKNNETMNAIKYNGDITVEWYKEDTTYKIPWSTITTNTINPLNINTTYTSTDTWASTDGTFGSYSGPLNVSSNCNTSFNYFSNKLETGRIENGSTSYQNFTYEYRNFSNFMFYVNRIKILPMSEKINNVKEINNIRQYCSECGSKIKNTFKYCPHCGRKI